MKKKFTKADAEMALMGAREFLRLAIANRDAERIPFWRAEIKKILAFDPSKQ